VWLRYFIVWRLPQALASRLHYNIAGPLSSLLQTVPNPERIAPQIQNGMNIDYVVFHLIIDSEWESPPQHSMEFKVEWMNTGKKNQRVKIGED
jgi:hypothetical protein